MNHNDSPLPETLLGLRSFALAFPGAVEDHPWGDWVAKVRGKVFVFLGSRAGGVGLSVKLPQSSGEALSLPFCQPTGYGLGKAGWVSAEFPAGNDVPVELTEEWIDESYRAIAGKRLAAALPPRA